MLVCDPAPPALCSQAVLKPLAGGTTRNGCRMGGVRGAEAAQLDEGLRPAEHDYRLVLVGGAEFEPDPGCSQRLQCFYNKAGGWGQLQDMGIDRPSHPGAAAVGTCLYAVGGEGFLVQEPECMTMCNLASGKMAKGAKLPHTFSLLSRGLRWPGVQPGRQGCSSWPLQWPCDVWCYCGRRVNLQP